MADVRTCPECSSELPTRSPEDLCPRCLVRSGITSDAQCVDHTGEAGATMSLGGPGGVLETLSATLGTVPRVLLRDTDAGPEPSLVRPDRGARSDGSTRYRIDGEIARGGMGTVLKGRDPDLGRDVAIKVLREELSGDPDMVRRFVEEAQIGGQLQHPGIVPIYELGAFADRRPFFSMRLVKGHTLAALLGARREPASDLPRFLGIVESVAQTMAYAHARGVIHRDLKPSNVMVGSFGEVQVMDWGLAKVLPRGGVADDVSAGKQSPRETIIATARSGSDDSDLSHAGSVMGTPSYMAPEQARGEIERVDERADVFALGSILCEVLTGQPAFVGRSTGEIQRSAALGDTAGSLARLDACGAGPELVALARDCLSREAEDRPRHAGAVADGLSAHLAGVQDRLRAAELAGVEANARADGERKRRKLTVALAASLLSTAALGGGGWAWAAAQRAGRAAVTGREVNQALAEAAELRGRAGATPVGGLALLELSLAEARRGTSLLAGGEGTPELRERARAVLAGVTRERDEAKARAVESERDRRMVDRLNLNIYRHDEHYDVAKIEADNVAAFRDYGIDVDTLSPADAADRIARRAVAADLVGSIDNWIVHRFSPGGSGPPDTKGAARLIAVADLADPDPWRKRLRNSLGLGGAEAFREIASTADVNRLSKGSLIRLTTALSVRGEGDRAAALLKAAYHRFRDDHAVNHNLAGCLLWSATPRPDEALPYCTAALALRPRNRATFHLLGQVLRTQGRITEAIATYHDLNSAHPDDAASHGWLSLCLVQTGEPGDAVASAREAVRLGPDFRFARQVLGYALMHQKDWDASIATYRAAIRIKSDDPQEKFNAYNELADALAGKGRPEEATSSRLDAVEVCREAIKLRPGQVSLRLSLGHALKLLGRLDEAAAVYREMTRLKPEDYEVHVNLGGVLLMLGRNEEGIAVWRDVLRLKPGDAWAHDNIGHALQAQGKYGEAVVEYRKAVALQPNMASARRNLISALRAQGRRDEVAAESLDAVAAFREAARLTPGDAEAHSALAVALCYSRDRDGAIASFREAARLQPSLSDRLFEHAGDRPDETIALFRTLPRDNPANADALAALAHSLKLAGRLEESVAASRAAIRLKPDSSRIHQVLGWALLDRGDWDGAIDAYRAAIRLKPLSTLMEIFARDELALALRRKGRFDEAIGEYHAASALGPQAAYLEGRIAATEREAALAARLPAVLKGEDRPRDQAEGLALGQLCRDKGLHAAAVRIWTDVAPAGLGFGQRYNPACSAALAGSGAGEDEPRPDEAAKARLRRQALDWLAADLSAWTARLTADAKPGLLGVAQLRHWKEDADLAGVRGPESLDKLPAGEREAWLALWADVDTLLKKAEPANH